MNRFNATLMCGCVCLATFTSAGVAQSHPAPWLDTASAGHARPIPGPVYESPAFTRAVASGMRTRTGRPGPRSFVQNARYTINATLDVATDRVSGRERVVYVNNSPDTLFRLMVYLRQNAFKPESPRRDITPLTTGVDLTRVLAGREVLTAMSSRASRAGYTIEASVMRIVPPQPLLPHDSITLEFEWSYTPPLTPSDGRQGREDHLYFMGYWYPQMAVYDDVSGWVADPYLLEAEFYMDMADYDVHITAPRGWVVGATGSLQNADAVLSASARDKLAQARSTGNVVTISRPETADQTFNGSDANSTWHFTARNVRDFAWGASDRYVWDATRALVSNGTRTDTVAINSYFRISQPAAAWALGGARYTRDAIEQLSKYIWPYPWPVMSSFEGVLTSGGMEYPMLMVMQPWSDTLSLAGDIMHETGHMWFPMQVGSNETRHPWMDEGFTQFNTAQAMRVLYGEPRFGGRP
ncbi:MAG: M1 family metallopeptidase, partial [Longimicrobiales bacterium]